MARKARPIDPGEGPLQAFAVELRGLRAAAGDPTYRAMSVRAGFSATTLSEAAGGMRKPSLDVTLAFVGVCGGDPVEWRERWVRLERALAPRGVPAERDGGEARPADEADDADDAGTATGTAAETEPPTDAPAPIPGPAPVAEVAEDTASAARGRLRWSRVPVSGHFRVPRRTALLASAVVLIAAAVAVPQLARSDGSPVAAPSRSASEPPGCPAAASGDAAFSGETYVQGTHEHSGARLDAPIIALLPAQCMLAFSGYCIGQDVRDQRSGTPDMRWFKLLGSDGLVASGVVHGNPPPDLAPTSCSDDAPPPAVVHLRVAAAQGAADSDVLSATGIDAPIIGYAAYYSEQQETETEAPNWHELALYDPAYLPAPKWDLTDVRAAISGLPGVPSGTVPVVAVACLGGGAPTQIVDATAVSPDRAAQTQSVQLTPQALATAEQAACQYPASG